MPKEELDEINEVKPDSDTSADEVKEKQVDEPQVSEEQVETRVDIQSYLYRR